MPHRDPRCAVQCHGALAALHTPCVYGISFGDCTLLGTRQPLLCPHFGIEYHVAGSAFPLKHRCTPAKGAKTEVVILRLQLESKVHVRTCPRAFGRMPKCIFLSVFLSHYNVRNAPGNEGTVPAHSYSVGHIAWGLQCLP